MVSNAKRDTSDINQLLRECAAALQSVANYHLPVAVDKRLLWLAENKEQLNDSECHRWWVGKQPHPGAAAPR